MFLVGISILWIPVIRAAQGARLFDYIQAVSSFLAPPVAACYLLGILWKRINEEGAFWGLICGLFIGIIRFIWEYSYIAMPCQLEHLDKRPSVVRLQFLYFSVLLFIISGIVTIVVSLLTKPIPEKYISGLTIFDLDNPEKAIEIPTRPGCMHRANTYYDEEQPRPLKNSFLYHIDQPPTETERKSLHFFETGIDFKSFSFQSRKSFLSGDSVGIVFYLKTAFVWICGLEKPDKLDGQSTCSDSHPHDNTSNRRNSTSIREEHVSSWHKECSYVAIIMLALSAFVWAFFTDYRIRLN
ncbi:unnamed protein product [Rotaria sp. Silwood1]|nr:unnamed protein product [Rotaria sp. Silwood1]